MTYTYQPVVQGSPEWIEWRKTKVCASDAPVIMGTDPWKTPYQLWQEKKGIWKQEETSSMKFGKTSEKQCRLLFESLTGCVMRPDVVESDIRPWQAASLDGIDDFLEEYILEIKCCNLEVFEMALKGIVPDYYMDQIQHQLAVTGCAFCYYMVYHSVKGSHYFQVFRNEERIAEINAKEEEFYLVHMIGNKPPDLTERDIVERKDEEWEIAAREAVELKKQIDELEAKFEEKRKHLIFLSNGKNCVGGGIRLSQSYVEGKIDTKKIEKEWGEEFLLKYKNPGKVSYRLTFQREN